MLDLVRWKWAEVTYVIGTIYEDTRATWKRLFILSLFLIAGIVYGGLKAL